MPALGVTLIMTLGFWMVVRPQSFFRMRGDWGVDAYLIRAYREAGKATLSITAFIVAARLIAATFGAGK